MKITVLLLALVVLAACSLVYIGDTKPRIQNATNPACLIDCDAAGTVNPPASAPVSQ